MNPAAPARTDQARSGPADIPRLGRKSYPLRVAAGAANDALRRNVINSKGLQPSSSFRPAPFRRGAWGLGPNLGPKLGPGEQRLDGLPDA